MSDVVSVVYSTRKIDNEYLLHVKKMFSNPKTEVIVYENNGQYNLPELYNKGLNESVNDIVVFIHDDLILRSKSMGEKICKLFSKYPEFGIIGVGGTTDLVTGKWWEVHESSIGAIYHQHNGKITYSRFSTEIYPEAPKEVVCVDGVVMMIHKKRIKKTFDEDFKGFHFYDIPFCVSNYIEGVKIGVTSKFDIVHKSIGNTNDEWEKNKLFFEEKYKDILPIRTTSNKTFNEKLNYSKNEIGVGIVSYGNSDRLLECMSKIPDWIENLVIVNCKNQPSDYYPNNSHIILEDEKKTLIDLKNSAIKYLLEKNCEHIFIMEDDILITDEDVFDKYIKTSVLTGIKFLSYALHGNTNKNDKNDPKPRQVISYPEDNIEVAFYKTLITSFSYYRREIFEKTGLFNKSFNIWGQLEFVLEASKRGVATPYWWFPDINRSWNYISSIDHNDKLEIDQRMSNLGLINFQKKYKFSPFNVPEMDLEKIKYSLKVFHHLR